MQGKCVYMNPMAETLCEVRLENIALAYETPLLGNSAGREQTASIEHIFARLLPRIRNGEETRHYLQEFGKSVASHQELHCTVADEPLRGKYSLSALEEHPRGRRESAATDYHYYLRRYPLYNQQGQCIAHALQVHDRTEQVRDEKNRSALLSAVSHDLRTPLTTIKVAVTGLLEEGVQWKEEDRKEVLGDIENETDHLTVLVNALVEMSRIEMGALSLDKEWCDIVEIYYGAIGKIERTIGPCAVRLVIQGTLPLVYVDHVQLERVFFYLLENIVHHGSEERRREGEVHLEVVTEQPGASLLRVVLTEQGRGLTAEERERIFSNYTSGTHGTNGLGLAICKGIVEAHQGEINIEAITDGGVRVTVTLPAYPSGVVRRGGEEVRVQEAATGQTEGQRRAGEKE
jgi:signal transduction histidine kinase